LKKVKNAKLIQINIIGYMGVEILDKTGKKFQFLIDSDWLLVVYL